MPAGVSRTLPPLLEAALASSSLRQSGPSLAPHVAWQQRRYLLSGKPRRQNLQVHKPKPLALGGKIKTPGVVKRRVILKNGQYVRYQAGRRHKRMKKSKGQLRALRGAVPLVRAYAKKLKKLGYKRSWWWMSK